MKKYFKCFVVAIIVLCSNISFAYASDIEGGNPAATYSSDGIFLSNDDSKRFVNGQIKSLDKVGVMVENNGGKYFKSLDEVAEFLNGGE